MATAALALVAAACGGGDSGPTGAGDAGAGDATETATSTETGAATETADGGAGEGGSLTVWAMGAEGEQLPDFVTEFEEAEGVDVEVTPVPWDVAHDKLLTAAAGQQSPDITQMGTTWMGEFASLGALVLDDSGRLAVTVDLPMPGVARLRFTPPPRQA